MNIIIAELNDLKSLTKCYENYRIDYNLEANFQMTESFILEEIKQINQHL